MQKKGFNTKVLSVKNQLYGLSYAPANHEKIYYFLLVDQGKEDAFQDALNGNAPFNIRDYATIIASGNGEPPSELKEQMRIKYNAVL